MAGMERTAAVTTQLNERQEGNLDAPKAAKPLSTRINSKAGGTLTTHRAARSKTRYVTSLILPLLF